MVATRTSAGFAALAIACAGISFLCLHAMRASAQGTVVIYRCTDAAGHLTLQNGTPCPKGSKQEKRVLESVPSQPPAPVVHAPALPATRADTGVQGAPAESTEPAVAEDAQAARLPPPPLFQCNTWDGDSYLNDSAETEPRCVRLDTTGIDGRSAFGAGEACEVKVDQCQRVPDGAACDAWKRRLRQAEAAWKFARSEQARANQQEYERIERIVRESTCGG